MPRCEIHGLAGPPAPAAALSSDQHRAQPGPHPHRFLGDGRRAYVEQGGTLYASLCADAAIPGMAQLFGASLSDHAPADEILIKLVQPFGSLPMGSEFRYRADPSSLRQWPATLELAARTVLAVDGAGRPALVSNSLGQGKTLLKRLPAGSLPRRPAGGL